MAVSVSIDSGMKERPKIMATPPLRVMKRLRKRLACRRIAVPVRAIPELRFVMAFAPFSMHCARRRTRISRRHHEASR
jgi:hypothetical protein